MKKAITITTKIGNNHINILNIITAIKIAIITYIKSLSSIKHQTTNNSNKITI